MELSVFAVVISLLVVRIEAIDLPFRVLEDKSEVYALPPLPYGYHELEPYIDEATVRAHHQGHHEAYRNKMNTFLNQWRDQETSNNFVTERIVDIIRQLQRVPDTFHTKLKNNIGGYINHCLYWSIMSPNHSGLKRIPNPPLHDEISRTFQSFDRFTAIFTQTALDLFGSGYVWLVRNPKEPAGEQLSIITTTNQDCPLSEGYDPLLVIDVWEHAYYLKHQFRRVQHITDWWFVVDWNNVDKLDKFWQELRSPKRWPHEEI